MIRIKRFRIKDNVTLEQIMTAGAKEADASWIFKGCDLYINKYYNNDKSEISIDIGFSKDDIKTWNDYTNIMVLDETFCQPYIPFYSYMGKDIKNFPFLEKFVKFYNEYLSSLDLLEDTML